MNKTLLLFCFCILNYAYTVAQSGNLLAVPKDSIEPADSLIAAAEALRYLNTGSSRVIVLSEQDTSFKKDTLVSSVIKVSCVIAFIGCDKEHQYTLVFWDYFYSEYLKTNNSEAAFMKAKTYLFHKYPDSPVTPILNCKKE